MDKDSLITIDGNEVSIQKIGLSNMNSKTDYLGNGGSLVRYSSGNGNDFFQGLVSVSYKVNCNDWSIKDIINSNMSESDQVQSGCRSIDYEKSGVLSLTEESGDIIIDSSGIYNLSDYKEYNSVNSIHIDSLDSREEIENIVSMSYDYCNVNYGTGDYGKNTDYWKSTFDVIERISLMINSDLMGYTVEERKHELKKLILYADAFYRLDKGETDYFVSLRPCDGGLIFTHYYYDVSEEYLDAWNEFFYD